MRSTDEHDIFCRIGERQNRQLQGAD